MRVVDKQVTVRKVYFEGDELSGVMRRKGIDIQQLSQKSGLSTAALLNIRDGNIGANITWATQICKGLGVTLSELFGTAFD